MSGSDEDSVSLDTSYTYSYSDYTRTENADAESASAGQTSHVISVIRRNPNAGLTPVEKFHNLSISAAVLAAVNIYRGSYHLRQFDEDYNLSSIAMKHSEKMAKGEVAFGTETISKQLRTFPFVVFNAHVTRHSVSAPDAFTNVVNSWTTNSTISKSILGKYNCAAAGFYVSDSKEGFFTLILGLRSSLGCSYFKGESLKSILLAERCLEILNNVREKNFRLSKMKIDLRLCDYAYKFVDMDRNKLTLPFVCSMIGKHSADFITFGVVKSSDAKPELIVKEWLNQMGKNMSYLGNFNRIGIGFKEIDGKLRSVILLIRSLQASIIDGVEKTVEVGVIADEIAEMMNKFREQHKLEHMQIDAYLEEVAQQHAVYVANGKKDENPLDDDYEDYVTREFRDVDVTHFSCCEMEKAAQALMNKWRNDEDCVSVILNDVSDIGIGVCFDDTFTCHITVIVAARGAGSEVINRIVHF